MTNLEQLIAIADCLMQAGMKPKAPDEQQARDEWWDSLPIITLPDFPNVKSRRCDKCGTNIFVDIVGHYSGKCVDRKYQLSPDDKRAV